MSGFGARAGWFDDMFSDLRNDTGRCGQRCGQQHRDRDGHPARWWFGCFRCCVGRRDGHIKSFDHGYEDRLAEHSLGCRSDRDVYLRRDEYGQRDIVGCGRDRSVAGSVSRVVSGGRLGPNWVDDLLGNLHDDPG